MNRAYRFVPVLLSLALLIPGLGALPVRAEDDDFIPERTLLTRGHGEAKVRPDSLGVDAMVESTAATLPEARNQTSRKMQKIIASLKALNIENMKLQTQGLNVYPVYGQQEKNRPPRVVGYRSVNSLRVTVTGAEADMLGETGARIVDTALNTGANNVGSLSFFVTDMMSARAIALDEAMKDARHNALVMAKAANVTITGVYSMEGAPQYGYEPRPVPMYSMKSADAAAEAAPATPIESGETTVTSDVSVRYKF